MRIQALTLYSLSLPLKREFVHASAVRHESENVYVRCELEDGTCGWGEGVPRAYVTGETVAGAVQQFAATPLLKCLGAASESWSDVVQLCEQLELVIEGRDPRGCGGNALRCAIELSVLDAYGRLFQEPVGAALNCLELARILQSRREVRYSTTITAVGAASERWSALKMRAYGFQQCKVKVGLKGVDDGPRLKRLRRWIGRGVDLRVDANEAWTATDVIQRIAALSPAEISCVEQPLPHEQVKDLSRIRREIDVPLMLDESLTGPIDAERAIADGTCDLFNLRLSKCGGLLPTLRLAAQAADAGLGYQLGCHPGESGILSAAGRHFASAVGGIQYLEGSYDRHLLRERLTNEDITFGYGGRAVALSAPGLSVTVDTTAVERLGKVRHVWG